MADKKLGGISFTVDGDDSGLKRIDESMDQLQEQSKKTQKELDKTGKSIDDTGKQAATAGKKVDGLGKDAAETGKKVGKMGDESAKAGKQVKEMGADTDAASGSLRNGVVAAGALATALGVISKASANAARDLQNMARLSGVGVEEFQRLAFGAQQQGVSVEKLGDIYKDTQDKIGDYLATGGGELADYFDNIAPKVGQTAEQFRNLSGPQALQLFATGLQQANLSASETTFYMESLANDAALLTPLLADNGKGFQEAGDRASELGVVLSEIQVAQLVEVDKAFQSLGSTISSTVSGFVADNGPAIINILESITGAVSDANKLLKEHGEFIKTTAIILGTATGAYYAYRAAMIAATVAQTAFNVAAKANPIGILVTALGTAAGAMLALRDNTADASDAIDTLANSTNELSRAERQRFADELREKAVQKQLELNDALEEEARIRAKNKDNKNLPNSGAAALNLAAASSNVSRLQKEYEDLIVKANEAKAAIGNLKIEIKEGAGQESGAFGEANKDLQKLIDKLLPLQAEERELLAVQAELNKAYKAAGEKNVPEIARALIEVGKQLDIVRGKMNQLPLTKVNDEFQALVGALPNNIPRAQSAGVLNLIEDPLKKGLENIPSDFAMSIGNALASGDYSSFANVLSSQAASLVGTGVTDAVGGALGGALGGFAGGMAGAVVSGLLAGKQEISRSVEIVFSDGIAQAFTNIEYDSLLGGSSSVIGFDFLDNERITNSIRNALSGLDDSIELIGEKVEDFEGSFKGDTIADALDNATEQYINAGFGSLEAFQEFGETASDTLNRITDTLRTTNEAIRNVVGDATELAIEQYTTGVADAINANQELAVSYWEAAKVALEDLATGVTEPLDAGADDLVRSSKEYQRAFETYLSSRISMGGNNFIFGGGNQNKTAGELIDYIDQNQLPEAISRLGEGVSVASIQFAEKLKSLIDGGNVTNALDALTNVIATDVENYSEQISNALEDLDTLGFGGVSVADFAQQYQDALKDTVTPEILANFANAAVLFEKIDDATESMNNELEKSADRINSLQQEYNALIGRDDLNALINYEERLTDARSDDERQLIKNIRYQTLLNEARDKEIDALSGMISVLQKAATEELDTLRDQLDAQVESSSKRLESIRDSLNDQIDAEQERASKEIDRLQAEQDASQTSISNAKSLINMLDSAMNTLGERSEDLQEKLFKQSFVDIQNAINTAKATGELPDAQLIQGAVAQLSKAGTGTFTTRVDREREALQARKLLSDLNKLSDEQLSTDEMQLQSLDQLIEETKSASNKQIDALKAQIDIEEDRHNDLVERTNAQYEAASDYYDTTIENQKAQLDKLNDIDNSFESFAQVLTEILNKINVATVAKDNANAGSSGSGTGADVSTGNGSGSQTITNEEIAEYLRQFTADNYVSDAEARTIYDAALQFGVSSSLVGDIINSQLTGGARVDINDWLNRNNLSATGSDSMNALTSAVNSMTSSLSAQLSDIAVSSGTTANVLNSSSDPSGFGLRVSQA